MCILLESARFAVMDVALDSSSMYSIIDIAPLYPCVGSDGVLDPKHLYRMDGLIVCVWLIGLIN